MNSSLSRFAALESRVGSNSSPRGPSRRVRAVRPRRCFQQQCHLRSVAIEGNDTGKLLNHGYEAFNLPPLSNSTPAVEFKQSTSRRFREAKEDAAFDQHVHRLGAIRSRHAHGHKCRDPYQVKRTDEVQAGKVSADEADHHIQATTNNRLVEVGAALHARDPLGLVGLFGKGNKSSATHQLEKGVSSKLPSSTFSQILHTVDPAQIVSPFLDIYRQISSKRTENLRLQTIDNEGLYGLSRLFHSQIQDIFLDRQASGALTLSDYRYLLKCTRMTGDMRLARMVWANMSKIVRDPKTGNSQSTPPDLDCFNDYIATICLGDELNPFLRHGLRTSPENLVPRTWAEIPKRLKGHRVGQGGLRAETAQLFQQMMDTGISGNEDTFCLLLVALARENDMHGIASILRNVWKIDVESPSGMDKDIKTLIYKRDSPLYPSQTLLRTLAHIYSINGSIPLALRVVDYISRQYEVPIKVGVWKELLNWTYVLSCGKSSANKYPVEKPDWTTGQLPKAAVANLWDTMTSEPYNIKPTVEMYNYLNLNLLRRQRFGEVQIRMEEGMEAHKRDVWKLSQAVNAFNTSGPLVSRSVLEDRSRDVALARLQVAVNRQFIRNWVRLLLKKTYRMWKGSDRWTNENIPKIFARWSLFLPAKVSYQTRTGHVSIRTGVRGLDRKRQQRYVAAEMASVLFAWERQHGTADARIEGLARQVAHAAEGMEAEWVDEEHAVNSRAPELERNYSAQAA